nr:alcohol dehydrogenase patd [Quercus suber]
MSELPSHYKRAVFRARGEPLVFESVPLVLPGPGELLVKVEACGVCHSDVFVRDDVWGAGYPRVPGHEIIGKVVAVAEGETQWQVGERVGGAWHGYHDNTCKKCTMGLFQMCDNELINGVTKDGGCESSLIAITTTVATDATKIDRLSQESRPRIHPPLCCCHGLGGLGHLALQYASKFGYRVVALSRDNKKEAFARKLGATEYISGSPEEQGAALAKLGGAACIMCTAPIQDSIGPLISGIGPLGKLLIVSVAGDVPISTVALVRHNDPLKMK